MKKFKYVCELCGKIEIQTQEEAFRRGWDYPPFIGTYRVLSPRKCPNCLIIGTAWAALVLDGKPLEELTETQLDTIERVLGEPENMIVF